MDGCPPRALASLPFGGVWTGVSINRVGHPTPPARPPELSRLGRTLPAWLAEPILPASTRPAEFATRNRLIGTGLDEASADAWIVAWEAQAAQDGLQRDGAYWEAGWRWIAAERERRDGRGW